MAPSVLLLSALLSLLVAVQGTGMSGKFRNLCSHTVHLYWKSPNGPPVKSGVLEGNGGETSFQTYVTHEFFFSAPTGPPKPLSTPGVKGASFAIVADQNVYAVSDDTTDPTVLKRHEDEQAFLADYFKRTGRRWLTYYPRNPPVFPLWPATEVGHSWTLNITKDAWHITCGDNTDACRSEIALNITVLAKSPRAFQVNNFLSDYESEFMIEAARPRMVASTVGHGASVSRSNTRTSASYYMDRKEGGAVTDALYRRAAQLFRMPQELLYSDRNAESINVLHYLPGQEYRPHYDWGSAGRPESRFLTLIMYFNTPAKGGATGFPKAGLSLRAERNNAMFFYSVLEDGNMDDMSLHSGEPVVEGEKWIGTIWLWDPHREDGKEPYEILAKYPVTEAQAAAATAAAAAPTTLKEEL